MGVWDRLRAMFGGGGGERAGGASAPVSSRPGRPAPRRHIYERGGPDDPELIERGLLTVGSDLELPSDPTWALSAGRVLASSAANLDAQWASVWNYACSALISGAVASVPPLVQVNGDLRHDHPILDLLHAPTPDHGWREWMYMRTLHLGLTGADYVEVYHRDNDPARPPVQLWPYPEGIYRTKVRPLSAGRPEILGFYRLGVQWRRERVIRSRFPDASDYALGLAPAVAAEIESMADREASRWQLGAYKNSLRPSALIILPTDEPEKIQRFRDTVVKGWANAGSGKAPIVMGGGIGDNDNPIAAALNEKITGSKNILYQQLTQTAVEADYVASREANRQIITAGWGVPDVLFSASSSTFTNLEEAQRLFWETTVMGYINTLYDTLNRQLVPMFRGAIHGTIKIVPDLSQVSALIPVIKARAELARAIGNLGWPMKTVNSYVGLGLPAFAGWQHSRVDAALGMRFLIQQPSTEDALKLRQAELLEAQKNLTLAQVEELLTNEQEVSRLDAETSRVLALLDDYPAEETIEEGE